MTWTAFSRALPAIAIGTILGVAMAAASGAQQGGGSCIRAAASPELLVAPVDSVIHRVQGATVRRRLNADDHWIVDYAWAEAPSHPGRLFDFVQLDSLDRAGELRPDTKLRLVLYRDEIIAASSQEAMALALERRPRTPPEELVRALRDEQELPFHVERDTLVASVPEPRILARLPLGEEAAQLSTRGDFFDETAGLGLAMIGVDDDVYVYDFGHHNLKRLNLSGDAARPQIIPGIPSLPDDGLVAADGDLYLLVDRWGNRWSREHARFVVFRRDAATGDWQESEPLTGTAMNLDTLPFGMLRISSTSADDIVVSAPGGAVTLVARAGRFLSAAEREADLPGRFCLGTCPNQDPRCLLVAVASADTLVIRPDDRRNVIGCDDGGSTYSLQFSSGDQLVLGKFAPDGHAVGFMVRPPARAKHVLGGKGMLQVSRRGKVLEFHIADGDLLISELTGAW